MDKVIQKAIEIRQSIEQIPEVKEYLRLKEIIENDEELKDFRKKIIELKNKNMLTEAMNLQELHDQHPLVHNFYSLKEELRTILQMVKDIIGE